MAGLRGMISLDELEQAHNPLSRKLLNVLLVGQERDGGWGDPLTTALYLRALLCGQGQGEAVQRALAYVSCDASSFARDLRVFLDNGWSVGSLRAFDLYPQTEHVELVTVLTPPA